MRENLFRGWVAFALLCVVFFFIMFAAMPSSAAEVGAEPAPWAGNPWAAGAFSLLALFLGGSSAISWAKRNAKSLGVSIGKYLPGDAVEKWLLDFLTGLSDGLRATMTAIQITNVQMLPVSNPGMAMSKTGSSVAENVKRVSVDLERVV